jgi:hypothetical protein
MVGRMANVLSNSITTGTPVTVPAAGAPATISTLKVGENNYQALEILSTVSMVNTGGATVAQDVAFDIRWNGVVVETIPKTNAAAAGQFLIPIMCLLKKNGKGTLTVTVRGLTSADATSSVTSLNFFVMGHY